MLDSVDALQRKVARLAIQKADTPVERCVKLEASQRAREQGAKSVISSEKVSAAIDNGTALATLNLYCKKTKVDLKEDFFAAEKKCVLVYQSCLRRVESEGFGNKKDAKKEAAKHLLERLGRA